MNPTGPMLGRRAGITRDHWRECCPGHTPLGDPSIGRRRAKRREAAEWRREIAPYLTARGLPQ